MILTNVFACYVFFECKIYILKTSMPYYCYFYYVFHVRFLWMLKTVVLTESQQIFRQKSLITSTDLRWPLTSPSSIWDLRFPGTWRQQTNSKTKSESKQSSMMTLPWCDLLSSIFFSSGLFLVIFGQRLFSVLALVSC